MIYLFVPFFYRDKCPTGDKCLTDLLYGLMQSCFAKSWRACSLPSTVPCLRLLALDRADRSNGTRHLSCQFTWRMRGLHCLLLGRTQLHFAISSAGCPSQSPAARLVDLIKSGRLTFFRAIFDSSSMNHSVSFPFFSRAQTSRQVQHNHRLWISGLALLFVPLYSDPLY